MLWIDRRTDGEVRGGGLILEINCSLKKGIRDSI